MRECDEIAIFILEWIIVEWHHAARGDAKLIIDGEGWSRKIYLTATRQRKIILPVGGYRILIMPFALDLNGTALFSK